MDPNNVENELGDCGGKPSVGKLFETEQEAYDFYNAYGGRVGFSTRRGYVNKNKEGHITSRLFVCNKEGFRPADKRDPLTKTPRQEVRVGCEARCTIKWDKLIRKYVVSDFVQQHNHPFVSLECVHMLPSRRKIPTSQATEVEVAEQSGIRLNATFELMGREAGGRESLGFTKIDQKNYLKTKRQKSLAYGEADSILQFFHEKTLENPSFFYAVQLDNEEQITNIFWADDKMIMDYGQFGDVVTFDTTYKLNNEYRPFASFIGFNHHRETVAFGVALMYDETVDSFIWLFRAFLEAMTNKAPKTILTDQDAAMAKVIPTVMPDTNHLLCTWHLMQNAIRHVNCIFKDKGVKGVLSTFMYDIEDGKEFTLAWEEMLDKYEVRDNHWLKLTFGVKEKWGWAYVRNTWGAGMSTTQLSESLNSCLKDYIRSDHNLMQFFMHFDRVLCDKRYKELQAEYALGQKLPMVKIEVKMLKQAGDIYTKTIFEEFQEEYVKSIEASIEGTEHTGETTVYTVFDDDGTKVREVTMKKDGLLACSCRMFEMKGILCSHCLKVLRERMKIKELPSQYILKRWTKCGHDIKVDGRLHQTLRYRSLMAIFRLIACRASESEDTYNLSVEKADELSKSIESVLSSKMNTQVGGSKDQENPSNTCSESFEVDGIANATVVEAKGLEKKECTSKGRRQIKGLLEVSLAKRRRILHIPKGVPQPPSLVTTRVPQAHPLFAMVAAQASSGMGPSSPFMYPTYNPSNMPFPMPLMYPAHPSYQALVNNASGYDFGLQDSQVSNSTACSQVPQHGQHGHGHDHMDGTSKSH